MLAEGAGPTCAAHPLVAATVACGRCGTFICSECASEDQICAACRERIGVREPTPFERRSEIGIGRGFFETWWLVISRPRQFYRSLQPRGDLASALFYAWLVLGVSWLVPMATDAVATLRSEDVGFADRVGSFLVIGFRGLVAPLVSALVVATLVHWACFLLDAHALGLRGTLRVSSYALSPALISPLFWIAGLGGGEVVMNVWRVALPFLQMALIVTGLVFACGARPLRAVATVIGPVAAFACLFVALYKVFSQPPG